MKAANLMFMEFQLEGAKNAILESHRKLLCRWKHCILNHNGEEITKIVFDCDECMEELHAEQLEIREYSKVDRFMDFAKYISSLNTAMIAHLRDIRDKTNTGKTRLINIVDSYSEKLRSSGYSNKET